MDNNEIWTPEVWTQINGKPGDPNEPGLLKKTMGPMQVARMIFSTVVQGNEKPIDADTIDLQSGIPTTGDTKAFAGIKKSYTLRKMHIQDEHTLTPIAKNQVTLAAQSLALVEDMLFFQGNRVRASLPKEVHIPESDIDKLEGGLLGIAEYSGQTIQVHPGGILPYGDKKAPTYGIATLAAVVQGISQFAKHLQGPPYALVLEPSIFGDAHIPLSDSAIITPASAIEAIIDKSGGHFVMSSGLPEKTGLLVSLGGNATTLYIGAEPSIALDSHTGDIYSFTARHSIQFHNIDPRSLIKLQFMEPVAAQ